MIKSFLVLSILILFFIPACASNASNDPTSAVIGYLEALVTLDENKMINNSCSDWEEQARLEHKSFAAVKADLVSPSCSVTGESSDYTLVSCTGKIIANYGAEDLEIHPSALRDPDHNHIPIGKGWTCNGDGQVDHRVRGRHEDLGDLVFHVAVTIEVGVAVLALLQVEGEYT